MSRERSDALGMQRSAKSGWRPEHRYSLGSFSNSLKLKGRIEAEIENKTIKCFVWHDHRFETFSQPDDSYWLMPDKRFLFEESKLEDVRVEVPDELQKGASAEVSISFVSKDAIEVPRQFGVVTGQPVIRRPPASRLVGALRFLFTERDFERIFGQVIADMREEYFDALSKGELGRARWRAVQTYLVVLSAVSAWVPAWIGKRLQAAWKAL